jgi:hypothetical protein
VSTTTSNSLEATLTADTAHAFTWAQWFDNIVVTNTSTTATLWVTTDGTVAIEAEAGAVAVDPSATVMLYNRQPKPVWYTPGEVLGPGETPQMAQNGTDLPASGYGTYVSVISTGTPTVVVSPQ